MSVPLPTPCHCVIRTRPSFDRFFAVLTTLPEKKSIAAECPLVGEWCMQIYLYVPLPCTDRATAHHLLDLEVVAARTTNTHVELFPGAK